MRVLIAEDDPVSRRLLESTLRQWDFQPVAVADGQAAWDVLRRPGAPGLVILDWNMPKMDGVEVCRRLRGRKGGDYSYVILLTGRGGKENILSGMDAGADDYIVKPFDVDELKVRLNVARRILDLQADLIAARDSLREQATHDGLTGLWNRRTIFDILDRELARAEREKHAVAVIMADVDHFKHINDTYGHGVGDTVLQEIANRMNIMIRPYDSIGRYGGEEFLIIVPGRGADFANDVAERARKTVGEEAIVADGVEVRATMSLGVAAACGPQHDDGPKLIELADQALYEAKRAGRNCSRIADAGATRASEQKA